MELRAIKVIQLPIDPALYCTMSNLNSNRSHSPQYNTDSHGCSIYMHCTKFCMHGCHTFQVQLPFVHSMPTGHAYSSITPSLI